jgi:DNA-binding transcriptional LysR family regulator
MVFACAPQHPLAGQSALTLAQLQGLPMVTFDRDLKIRRAIDRALARHDVDVQRVMAFDNTETIKRAVEIDAGFGLLPEPTIMREVQLESLVAIPVIDVETGKPALTRPLSIVYRRGAPLSMTTQRFVRQLREVRPEGDEAHAPRAGHGPPEPRRGRGASQVMATGSKRVLPPVTSEVPELS